MKPSASAPASVTASASSRFVIPQILIQVIKSRGQWPVVGGQQNRKSCQSLTANRHPSIDHRSLFTGHWPLTTDHCLHQLCQRFARPFRSHQPFADQERFVAGGSQTSYVCARSNAAFGHADAGGGYFLCEPECGFEIDFEGAQITAVDADYVAPGIERALQFRFVMRFAQNVEAVRSRDPGQRYQ